MHPCIRSLLILSVVAMVAIGVIEAEAQLAAAKLNRITVKDGDWQAPRENIEAVCRSAAAAIWKEAQGRTFAPIVIGKSDSHPIVLYERGASGEYQVFINVQGTYWAQTAYQFAHEFGHIWFNTRPGSNAQLWLEESLCEMASLYALRRMAEMWEQSPPYPNWKSYAPHLQSYAEERIKAGQLEEGVDFVDWFSQERKTFEAVPHDRNKNLVVAIQILNLVEANPRSWQALAFLNRGKLEENQSLETYLAGWHSRVPKLHQPFVREVAELFSVEISAPSTP